MAKRKSKKGGLQGAAQDPALRAVAASTALAATGVLAAGKLRSRHNERLQEDQRRYRLRSGEYTAEGVGRVARGQLDIATELLEHRHGQDDGVAVHEARKALKRLRALLRVSRDHLGDEAYRRENVALRDVGRRLSSTRDAQVLLDTFDALMSHYPEEVPEGAFSRFREVLAQDAEAASAAMENGAVSAPAETLTEVRMRVPTWNLPDNGGARTLEPGLARIYRRGRRAVSAAKDQPDGEHLHELRKRAKDLWHASQLLRESSPKRMKKMGRSSHRLSDLLGDDHDLLVLQERADASAELLEHELELLSALIARRRRRLQGKALKLASKLYARKPKRVRRLVR